jgi:hypothetical protein
MFCCLVGHPHVSALPFSSMKTGPVITGRFSFACLPYRAHHTVKGRKAAGQYQSQGASCRLPLRLRLHRSWRLHPSHRNKAKRVTKGVRPRRGIRSRAGDNPALPGLSPNLPGDSQPSTPRRSHCNLAIPARSTCGPLLSAPYFSGKPLQLCGDPLPQPHQRGLSAPTPRESQCNPDAVGRLALNVLLSAPYSSGKPLQRAGSTRLSLSR